MNSEMKKAGSGTAGRAMTSGPAETFQCRQCGACCRWAGDVVLEAEDVARLAQRLGMAEEAFIERHTHLSRNRKALSLKEHADGSCEFLSGDGCEVYDARPRQCREFPHTWRVKGCPALEALEKESDWSAG